MVICYFRVLRVGEFRRCDRAAATVAEVDIALRNHPFSLVRISIFVDAYHVYTRSRGFEPYCKTSVPVPFHTLYRVHAWLIIITRPFQQQVAFPVEIIVNCPLHIAQVPRIIYPE